MLRVPFVLTCRAEQVHTQKYYIKNLSARHKYITLGYIQCTICTQIVHYITWLVNSRQPFEEIKNHTYMIPLTFRILSHKIERENSFKNQNFGLGRGLQYGTIKIGCGRKLNWKIKYKIYTITLIME